MLILANGPRPPCHAAAKVAKPNTLYHFPVSGNALGAMLYITEKKLPIDLVVVDILAGEQLQVGLFAFCFLALCGLRKARPKTTGPCVPLLCLWLSRNGS